MLDYAVVYPGIQRAISNLCGDSACLSYPMPDIENGIRVERFFVYSMAPGLVRAAPFGVLTTEMDSGMVLAFQNCRLKDYFERENTAPIRYELPRKISVKEFRLEQSMINKLYEAVRRAAFKEQLTEQETVALRAYYVMLEKSVPVSLLPFYQAIGKNFYEWVIKYV